MKVGVTVEVRVKGQKASPAGVGHYRWAREGEKVKVEIFPETAAAWPVSPFGGVRFQ